MFTPQSRKIYVAISSALALLCSSSLSAAGADFFYNKDANKWLSPSGSTVKVQSSSVSNGTKTFEMLSGNYHGQD